MASKINPPAGFLEQFSHPLWETIKLDVIEPLWIVEGVHQGFSYTVLELEHGHTHVLAGGMTDESTIFIVKLPKKSNCWQIVRKPAGYRVSVDEDHVYLTQIGKQPRVKDWPYLLDLTVGMANSLVERSEQQGSVEEERVWNVSDRNWIVFWQMTTGILPFLMAGLFVNELSEYLRYDYVRHCENTAEYAKLLTGHNAWLYLSLLAMPIPVSLKMRYTIAKYLYRKHFALRLGLDALLLFCVSAISIYLAFTKPVWVGHLEDGTMISCYSNIPHKKISASP